MLGRTGAVPQRSCVTLGGALHVVDAAATLQVVERDGLIMALASDTVTSDDLLAAYDATATTASTGVVSDYDSRRRVNALRAALGDVHAKKGAFAVVLFDAALGRVLAARTANSVPVSYGFTADGTLVACAGLSSENMFPECGASALELTHLPSGRFIFGHRYVKPIEFTQFWGTAAANRSAAPARKASDLTVRAAAALDTCAAVVPEEAHASAEHDLAEATKLVRRWGNTGTEADVSGSWKRHGAGVSVAAASFAPTFVRAKVAVVIETAAPLPLPTASRSAYVPPGMRRAAAEAAAAAETAAAEAAVVTQQTAAKLAAAVTAEMTATAARSAVLSPRTTARNVASDAQVAAALASQENIVTSLEYALVSALERNLAMPASAKAPAAAASASAFYSPAATVASSRIPEESDCVASPETLELDRRRSGSIDMRRGGSVELRRGGSVDYARGTAGGATATAWEMALAVSRGAAGSARRSMEACSRTSVELNSASQRGSMDGRGSMEVARMGM